jgi:anti-sigma factor RsiW
MPAYASGEASAETRRLIEEHLAGCAACRTAFGKGARVEGVLRRADAPRVEKPVNGQKFVSRTRRLFFFVAVGVLLLFAAHAAVVMRVFTKAAARGLSGSIGTTPGAPFAPLPVAAGPVLALAVGAALVYVILVLSRTRVSRGAESGGVGRAVAGGALLTILALTTLYLWIAGPFVPGLIASLLLLGALGITVARLDRLPYFTIVTIVSLCVALVALLNLVLVGRMMGNF